MLIGLVVAGVGITNSVITPKDKSVVDFIENKIGRELVYERTPLINNGEWCEISRMNVSGTNLKTTGLRIKRLGRTDNQCIEELTEMANKRLKFQIENAKEKQELDEGGVISFYK